MTSWAPFVSDVAERERLAAIIREIIAELDRWPGEESLLDVALARAYVADIVPDDDPSGNALSRALTTSGNHVSGIALYGGSARVGWTIAHMSDGDVAESVCASIDNTLLDRFREPWRGSYDLISGAVGLGVYALERGDAGLPLARSVLDGLEQLAIPRGAGLAWFTAPELLPAWQREGSPGGYWNLGLAHGMAGVIALLARFVAAGIEVTRARSLLDGAVAHLLALEPPTTGPRFGSWYSVPEAPQPKARVAWCYGDLGIAVALLSAARACDHAGWHAEAIGLAHACATRPPEDSGVVDAGICHGAFGAVHLFHRMHRATGDATLATATREWLDRALALRNSEPIAGFPAFELLAGGGVHQWTPDASMLTGAAGVALVLHALMSDLEPAWDRLLLADL
jgi:hypothetical protein